MGHRILVGALALSTVLSPVLFMAPASAQSTPSNTARGKSGTIPVQDATNATMAKGIKDKGMTSCDNCGLTGRAAAPTPSMLGDDIPLATGKGIKDNAVKGAGNIPPSTGRVAEPRPTDHPAMAGADKGKSGTIKSDPATAAPAEQRNNSGAGGKPSATAKGGKTGWILGIGGLAAIVAVLAASGSGNDSPASR
jgi:hypothetical protein